MDSEVGHLSLVKYIDELDTGGMEVQIIERNNNALGSWKCRCKFDKIFGSKHCEINALSVNGAMCLHLACENGHYKTVEYILKHGVEVNAMN